MKMSRIVDELERQGIEVTYENIAIYAVFVSEEKLIDRLKLNEDQSLFLCNKFSVEEIAD